MFSPSYSTLVTALEVRDAVTLGYVQQSLICEEQRLKESNIQQTSLDKMCGTRQALIGKMMVIQAKDIKIVMCAICMVKQEIFIRIVRSVVKV